MADTNAELIAQMLDFVPADGTPIGNGKLRQLLSVKRDSCLGDRRLQTAMCHHWREHALCA